MDKGNRCIIWADAHTGVTLRAEKQFIHNSKIASSALNEKKAFDKTRQRYKPQGRYMGIPQVLHQLLGYSDVYSTSKFQPVETTPFEYRATTRIKLDRNGNVVRAGKRGEKVSDRASAVTDACSLRRNVLPSERQFTTCQRLLLQPSTSTSASYDKITLFGLRPVEILKLFPRVRDYYEWFVVEDKVMKKNDISAGLSADVTECLWIDGLGRRVRLRKQACNKAKAWLEAMEKDDISNEHSGELRTHLLDIINRGCEDNKFIKDDTGEEVPIVVFSRVSPNRSSNFLLHIMLALGQFDTELDLKASGSMKDSLAMAKLIPSEGLNDPQCLWRYGKDLLLRVVNEILPLQPVTMPGMDDFIVKADQLIQSVLLHDMIPITDMPPSILTQVFNDKTKEMENEWKNSMKRQLDSIMANLGAVEGLPSKDSVMNANRLQGVEWDPLSIPKFSEQSEDSYSEQRMALSFGVKAVDRYCQQFGSTGHTKGILNNGAPGAGKTFVLQAQGLYAMTKGLRVMSTSLMAVRSNAIGGYHLHRLFQWEVGKNANLFRLAEVSFSTSPHFLCKQR